MTIPAGTPNRNDYAGNDTLAIYPFTYPILNQTQLKVWVQNLTTGVWMNGENADGSLIYDTDYTVTGEEQPGGGSIELINNAQAWLDATTGFLNTGWNMVIRMYPGLSQNTSFGNGGPFYEESVDNLADTLAMTDLEQQDEIDRSIKLPVTENPTTYNMILPTKAQRASTYLAIDVNGNLICTTSAPIPILLAYTFAALPAQTAFAMAICTDGPFAIYNPVLGSWQKVDMVSP